MRKKKYYVQPVTVFSLSKIKIQVMCTSLIFVKNKLQNSNQFSILKSVGWVICKTWYPIGNMLRNNKMSTIKFQVNCTSLRYVTLICEISTSYPKNCRRSYPYYMGTLWEALHFHYFINRIFPLENPVKKSLFFIF